MILHTQKVLANAIRVVFNGWPTDERMRGVLSRPLKKCILCGAGQDRIEHYAHCNVYWKFASAMPPAGLGLSSSTHRSLDHFLLACRPAAKSDILKLATGSYALQRVLIACRDKDVSKLDIGFLLRWYANQAVVKQ